MNLSFRTLIIIICIFTNISCKKDKKDSASFTYKNNINYINYYPSIYLADSLYIEKHYEDAFKILDSIFKIYKPINMEMFYEYETYISCKVALNNTENTCDELKTLIQTYGYNKQLISSNIFLLKLLESCPKIKDNFSKYYDIFKSSINLELRNEIYEMSKNDQKYRSNGLYSEFKNEQDDIDEQNTLRIIEIFNKFEYPNTSIIGNYVIDKKPTKISTMLLHTNDSIRVNYFIPKVTEYVKHGQCSPHVLGSIVDQLRLYNGESQLYGTYTNSEIENLQKIDSTRATIGLPRYGYENWRLRTRYGNIELNIK